MNMDTDRFFLLLAAMSRTSVLFSALQTLLLSNDSLSDSLILE